MGEAKEARRLILRIGERRFGVPDATIVAALEAVLSLDALEEMAERLLEVESWEELLNGQ